MSCSKPNWFNLQNKQTKNWKIKSFILSIFWNSMNISNMRITIASMGKSHWAVVAWKWFLPRMCPYMSFYICLHLHDLNTKRTLVLFYSKPNWFNLQKNKQTIFFLKNQILLFHQYFGNSWYFLTCALQLLVCAKVLGQYEHLKGFSPVWVKICLLI